MGAFETATARRSILKGFGALAVGAGLPAKAAWGQKLLANPGVELHPQVHCPPPSAWSDLARALKGALVMPDDPFFGDYYRPNNLRFIKRPGGIARCSSADDVAACLNWAKTTNTPFAVRSGGHNYAGYSNTEGLLIDMSPMAGILEVDEKSGTVKIAGGTINSLVYKALERLGRTITHGRCDGVGAAGFLLGGGIGFNMRLYGIGSDLLHKTDLVLADGNTITASDGDDLLWACQGGGGGNFGINTSFTLQTFKVSTVTVFELSWSKDLDTVLYNLLHRLQEAPNGFGCKISVSVPARDANCFANAGMTVSVLGQAHFGQAAVEKLFGDLWQAADKKKVEADMAYWSAQDVLSEATFPYYYREKSTFMNTSTLTKDTVAALMDSARGMPRTSMGSAFKFFQVGGAVNNKKPGQTAFVHRGYDWLFSSEVNWWAPKDPDSLVNEALAWQESFYALALARTKAVGAYQNFPDPSLKDWQQDYYGDNYAKLRAVKTKVDPKSLFSYAQGIKPV
ncbi:FAD-binding oxidoreductase [Nitrospirillum pindoramense]|uniref:FAD/FMN-containing dehydrogenase n=1 Tax=Nitrospirillum amazonense TaxID=28077 RepID=A0A560HDK2_9PROT|nr:FAD-binding oxidoreductase [Nitrospirillum amazonense]TWB44141.1 FAD/FMN-containing dehydrogenase [Nitrospirillum amazonense]